MQRLNQEEENYRVFLMGIEDDTEERREAFCKTISLKYNLSATLLREVVDRSPIVLRNNLPLRKAKALARTLKHFGALVSVETKNNVPSILLEFQDPAAPRVSLEDAHLWKTPSQTWNVTGKVKNVCGEDLMDLWVLVQLFEEDGTFLTFEEVPIPINPLPPQRSSPFKIIAEGSLPVKMISLTFKNSMGNPLPSSDERKKGHEIEGRAEGGNGPSPPDRLVTEEVKATGSVDPQDRGESLHRVTLSSSEIETEGGGDLEAERPAVKEEREEGEERRLEARDQPRVDESPLLTVAMAPLNMPEGEPVVPAKSTPRALEQGEVEMMEMLFPELKPTSEAEKSLINEPGKEASALEEAGHILAEMSGPEVQSLKKLEKPAPEEERLEREGLPAFAWMDDFRRSIETYYHEHLDPFSLWFEEHEKAQAFGNRLQTLLVLLVHSRFDQMTRPEKALENTQKVYPFILEENLSLENIPSLEGTKFFSADQWRMLFHRAISRLQQIARDILSRERWDASELAQLIQVVPHMSVHASRRATRRIHALIPEILQIDFSRTRVVIEKPLYRVVARLGVVDPQFDPYEGLQSMGDAKIQCFGRAAFPEDVMKIEEPLSWVGGTLEGGGHCSPVHPRCEGCLFGKFCSRLLLHIDPAEKGCKTEK